MIDLREAATRKLGPLPAWAWGAVIGGGLLVYSLASGKGASSPFTQTLASADPYNFDASGGGGGGGTGSPSDGSVIDAGTPVTPTQQVSLHGARRGGSTLVAADPTIGAPTPVTALTRSTQRTRAGTGDTDPNPLPLGLPLPRWDAILATQTQAAASYLSMPPSAPSAPIPVPGSVTMPTLPPIIRAQGDTRKFDPRGWATIARDRARAGVIPTTMGRPITVPPSIRQAIAYARPRQNG